MSHERPRHGAVLALRPRPPAARRGEGHGHRRGAMRNDSTATFASAAGVTRIRSAEGTAVVDEQGRKKGGSSLLLVLEHTPDADAAVAAPAASSAAAAVDHKDARK